MAPPISCVQMKSEEGDPSLWLAARNEGYWQSKIHKMRKCLIEEFLHEHLTDPCVHLVFANAPYDMLCIMAQWPRLIPSVFKAYDDGRVHDVLIRQKLLDIATNTYRGHLYDLETLAKKLCKITLDKDDSVRLTFGELRDKPLAEWPQKHIDYALADVDAHLKVYFAQESRLDRYPPHVLHDEPAQCRADLALQLMSAWGIRTDEAGAKQLEIQCKKTLDALRPALQEAGLVDGQGKKKMRIAQQRILDAWGDIQKCKRTDTGKDKDLWELKYISTDEESCQGCGDPLMSDFAVYASTSNLLTGHVKAMYEGIRKPIHSRFEVLMATGRTSSSSPNIQNVRRAEGARECFIPRDGHVFLSADVDKAELHTLAQICVTLFGASRLAERLNGGFDPHLDMGAQLTGITYEAALKRFKAGDEKVAEARQAGKPANFGFPGGMGPRGMMIYAKSTYGIVMSLEKAEELHAAWKRNWPDVLTYLQWVKKQQDPITGFVDVRHLFSERYRAGCFYPTACNSMFQGLAADATKAALYEIAKRCYLDESSPLFGCRPVNFVHDEYILEAPEEYASEAADELQRVVCDTFSLYTPDVPARATPQLMRRWSKKAKPVRDPRGRLIPWEDRPAA